MFRPKENFLQTLIHNLLPNQSILIIDDEVEVQKLMANFLKRANINEDKILFASNGSEALNKMLDHKIGLLIVDIVMPQMNGLEFIREIKEIDQFKHIPIVISSGNLKNEMIKHIMLFGVKEVVVKPFQYNQFIDRICRALGN